MRKRAWSHLLSTLSALAIAGGCANGGGALTSRQSQPADQPAPPSAGEVFPGLPELPSGDRDLPGAAKVTLADNVQTGDQYFSRGGSATVNGTALELFSTGASDLTFGIWRWSGFTGGVFPLDLTLDWTVESGSQAWVMLSDYTTGLWEMHGPLDGATSTFTYGGTDSYISPGSNTYVAVLTVGGSHATVNSINVTADQDVLGPCKPTNLHTTNVTTFAISLAWDECEPSRNNIWMIEGGPGYDFDTSEATLVATRSNSTYTASGLTPGTTYHFRIEPLDSVSTLTGPLSDRLDVTTVADAPPTAPGNLHTTSIGGTSASLAWDASTDDGGIITYSLYKGPADNFDVDSQGTLVASGISATNYTATGLNITTAYHFRCVAVDVSNQHSPASNTCNFTTVTNQAPNADFNVFPTYPVANDVTAFDPSPSSDDTTPLDQCTADWDYDGDGTYDETGLAGNALAQHTYLVPGDYDVTLKLWDEDGEFGLATKTVHINGRVDVYDLGVGHGFAGTVLAADCEPTAGRIAVAVKAGSNYYVYVYSGSSWSMVDATAEVGSDTLADVALAPSGGVGILHHAAPNWTIGYYNGSSWSSGGTGSVSGAAAFISAALAYSPGNGRYACAVMGPIPAGTATDIWDMYIYHQTGAGRNTVQPINNFHQNNVFDLCRNDTTTYCAYAANDAGTDIKVAAVQDGSNSSTSYQTAGSRAEQLQIQKDPGNSAQVLWSGRYGSTIFWGDNYGAGNGAQTYATGHSSIVSLLGNKVIDDNDGAVYWVDRDSNGKDYLRGYQTTTSTLWEIKNAQGLADSGSGAYVGGSQVYFATTEDRDGTVHGFSYNNNTAGADEIIHDPISQAGFGGTNAAVAFADGSLLGFVNESFPNALRVDCADASSFPTGQVAGYNAWVQPNDACRTSNADLAMLVSSTDEGNLTACTFSQASGTAVDTLDVGGVKPNTGRLAYNPASGKVCLAYVQGNDDVTARVWDGAAWSAPVTVYNGSSNTTNIQVADKPGGEFGLAFYDDNFNMRLAESSGSGTAWGSPTLLSSATCSTYAGIGMDYNGGSTCYLAVEREAVEPGIWIGTIPDGGSVSWEKAVTTFGTVATSIELFARSSGVDVLYYDTTGGNLSVGGKIKRVYKVGATWTNALLPFFMHGVPFGSAMDANENIFICGIKNSVNPSTAMAAVLHAE